MSWIGTRKLIHRGLMVQWRGLASASAPAVKKTDTSALPRNTASAQPSRKTALYDFHVAKFGRMVNFCGWSLPVQYTTSVIQSHLYTRLQASIFDVSHMLQLHIKGKDRIKFMEHLVVSDLINLTENTACLTVYTNNQGGIIDDLMITKTDQGYLYVVSNAGRATQDLAHLHDHLEKAKSHGMDVDIEVLEHQALLALQGPRSAEVLQQHLPPSFDLSKFYFMQSRTTLFDNSISCRINRSGYTGEDGFEISVPNVSADRVINALLTSGVAQLAGLGARDSLRLEAGLCLYGNDIDEQTTPIEADLAWTIGKRRRQAADFPGAKIILEQIAQGPPRKRVGIKSIGSCPRSGAEIRSGRGTNDPIIGKVTSGCPSPSLKLVNIGMCYVESPWAKVGSKIIVNARNRILEAEIVKLPFVPTNYYKAPSSKKK